MADKKEYIRGGAKEWKFDNGSSIINFSVNINDDNIKNAANAGGWVNLTMTNRRSVDDYGNTHTVYINNFKPEKKDKKTDGDKSSEKLPF